MTVSRELRRTAGLKGYRPRQAHHLANVRQLNKPVPRIREGHWLGIVRLFKFYWSPEQNPWRLYEKQRYVDELHRLFHRYTVRALRKNPVYVHSELINNLVESMSLAGLPEHSLTPQPIAECYKALLGAFLPQRQGVRGIPASGNNSRPHRLLFSTSSA